VKLRHYLATIGFLALIGAPVATLLIMSWPPLTAVTGAIMAIGVICISVAAIITPEKD
jgi:hypothetical protein